MNIPLDRVIKVAEAWHLAQCDGTNLHSKEIEITAEEPCLYRDGQRRLNDLIWQLNNNGFEIKVTSNGSLLGPYVSEFSRSVKKVRVSLHSLDKKAFYKITGSRLFNEVVNNVITAAKSGVPVTLNRLVLKDYLRDITAYLDFASSLGLKVKLLQPHFTSNSVFDSFANQDKLLRQVISAYITPRLVAEPYRSHANPLSPRMIYPIGGGSTVEVRLASANIIDKFSYCRNCELFDTCAKSNCLLPTSAKLTPDGRLILCSVRNYPGINLNDYGHLENMPEEKIALCLKESLNSLGLVDKEFYLPIRAIVTIKCNFKFFFYHAEGYDRKKVHHA